MTLRGIRIVNKKSNNFLKGNALDIYRLILTSNKPLGIREIQRTLNLSSPSIAQYHLAKLEEAKLLRHEAGCYVVDEVVLENCIKINRFLIPRYLFYSFFAVVILFFELTIFKPTLIYREYLFSLLSTCIFVIFFVYEALKVWLKKSL